METINKILWVDDEIELLKSNIIFLRQKGYDVVESTNGEDAVRLIGENEFDLVFLDEMMPGMGGLQTLLEIKETKPNNQNQTKPNKTKQTKPEM